MTLKSKKTVLLSTHILPEAQKICDRLLIIHQGQFVAQGSVAEIQGQKIGETTIYARLNGPPEEVLTAVRSIPEATGAEQVDEVEPGCPGYRITASADLRTILFNLAAEKKWPIMEMRPHSASLDEVFLSLTGASREDPQ